MNGIRISIALPGRPTPALLAVARHADTWNLGGIWAGDPRAQAANSDDSYVSAAARALAGATEHLRLGMFLSLRGSAGLMRLAEDIAVVDQVSAGRVELALVPPAGDPDAWSRSAAELLHAWNEVKLPDGKRAAVTPPPAQPTVPRLVVGGGELADALRAGSALFDGSPAQPERRLVRERRVLMMDAPFKGSVRDWLAAGPLACVRDLRARATKYQAGEILFVLASGREPDEADIKALGTVVVPALRAADDDLAGLVGDAWEWLTKKEALHQAP